MSIKDQLSTSLYFQSPIYHIEIPEMVDDVIKFVINILKKQEKI
jgi:hypothetical protein